MLTSDAKRSRPSQYRIQEQHPEVPRYSVIPHEVWSVCEFVNGKSRRLGDGLSAALAFEIADRLAAANSGMAGIMGGAGFSLESNYSPYYPHGPEDPNSAFEMQPAPLSKRKLVSAGSLEEHLVEEENPVTG